MSDEMKTPGKSDGEYLTDVQLRDALHVARTLGYAVHWPGSFVARIADLVDRLMSASPADEPTRFAGTVAEAAERRRMLAWEIAKIRQNYADTQVSRALARNEGDMAIADMMRVEWNANAQWDRAYPTLASLALKPIAP